MIDLKEKIHHSITRLALRLPTLSVKSLYALTAASTLLPAALAVQSGVIPAAEAITILSGSVGAGLLANMLQKWKDEEDIIDDVNALPFNNSLQNEIDAALIQNDAINIIRANLTTTEFEKYVIALREDLAARGNLPKYQPYLISRKFRDVFSVWEDGLDALDACLGKDHPLRDQFDVAKPDLIENLSKARAYGDSSDISSKRFFIIGQLNRIARDACNKSFSELCGL